MLKSFMRRSIWRTHEVSHHSIQHHRSLRPFPQRSPNRAHQTRNARPVWTLPATRPAKRNPKVKKCFNYPPRFPSSSSSRCADLWPHKGGQREHFRQRSWLDGGRNRWNFLLATAVAEATQDVPSVPVCVTPTARYLGAAIGRSGLSRG